MFPDETIHSVNGHSCDNNGTYWKVNCPLCEKEFEYMGYFNSKDITECKCGCRFQTKRIYFEDNSYME